MAHRVRSIIQYLSYKELSKVLPKEKMFTSKSGPPKGGKTPSPTLAKKLGASDYGLFMEEVIEILLSNGCDIEALNKLTLEEDLQKYFKPEHYQPLANLLKEEFSNVQYQVELVDIENNIVGHPDLLSYNTVYDIKTTGRFNSMRIQTIFQLLSYYSLCHINKLNVKYIGLVLPLQLKIIKYDLSQWDYKPFYSFLVDAINAKIVQVCLWDIPEIMKDYFFDQVDEHVGFHCSNDQLSEHMKNNVPALQFFVNGNVNGNVVISDKLIKDLKTPTISKMFIHSPYILNFSCPGISDRDTNYDYLEEASWGGWTFNTLIKLLDFGKENGNIRGIILHCGKRCGGDYNEAVFNMFFSIMACSSWASPECKILIESSCNQHGEILSDPNELADFYLALPECVQEVVAICVDTCHVFVSGNNPYEYIKILEKRKVPIDLVHYNDSKGRMGSCKDRHSCIGNGYIGYEILNQVLQYCIENNIPMLRE